MNRHNGFTLIEVIVSTMILFTVIAVAAPIISTLHEEKLVLSERRAFGNALHDELQVYLWSTNPVLPHSYSKKVQEKDIIFQFERERELIKGCVNWLNAKGKEETFCLYGLSK